MTFILKSPSSHESRPSRVVLYRCVHPAHHFPILSDNLLSPDFQARKSTKQAIAFPCHTSLVFLRGFVSLTLVDLIVDLENEAYLQVPIGVLCRLWTSISTLGSLSPICSFLPPTSGRLGLMVLFTACEDTLQVLLAYHLVRVPVNDVDRDTINILEEHVPVLVLRLIFFSCSTETSYRLCESAGGTWFKETLVRLTEPTFPASWTAARVDYCLSAGLNSLILLLLGGLIHLLVSYLAAQLHVLSALRSAP